MTQEFVRFLIAAALWTAALFTLAAVLTGCNVEGAGFTNTGRQKSPVKCEEVAARHVKCRSE